MMKDEMNVQYTEKEWKTKWGESGEIVISC